MRRDKNSRKRTVSRVLRKPFGVVRSGLNENLIILCRLCRRHHNNSHRVLITPIRRRQGRKEKTNPSPRAAYTYITHQKLRGP